MVYGLGMVESGMTVDYAQLVLDNEMAKMIKAACQGIQITDETLALDVIEEVKFKEYISHADTYKHMRNFLVTDIFDRQHRMKWEEAGSKSSYDMAKEKAQYILKNHQPHPVDEKTAKTIRQMMEEFTKELMLKNAS